MTWRDRLQPASFRGVRFEHLSHSGTAGRRFTEYEYPNGEMPTVDDLGIKARRWTFRAFLIGPDYMERRDQLLAAIEKEGAGELVHPWIGSVNAACTSCTWDESSDEGGMARFSLSFIEVKKPIGTQTNLKSGVVPGEATKSAAADVSAESQANFIDGFEADDPQELSVPSPGFPQNLLAAGNDFSPPKGPVQEIAERIAGWFQQGIASAFSNSTALSQLRETAIQLDDASLATNLASLAGQWRDNLLDALPDDPEKAVRLARYVIDRARIELARLPSAKQGTPARRRRNSQAIWSLTINTLLVTNCTNALQVDFNNRDEAFALRDMIIADLSTWLETIGADKLWQEMIRLRAVFQHDMTQVNSNRISRKKWALPEALPALVVTYRLKGDTYFDADLIAQNKIRQPALLGAGLEIWGS